jgi:hypothetical protein
VSEHVPVGSTMNVEKREHITNNNNHIISRKVVTDTTL